jgi:hypothetical protein
MGPVRASLKIVRPADVTLISIKSLAARAPVIGSPNGGSIVAQENPVLRWINMTPLP